MNGLPDTTAEDEKRLYVKNTTKKFRSHVRSVTYSAIRDGIISKGNCDVCGSKDVDAHHTDYRFPLDVRWLCRQHHYGLHKKEGSSPSNTYMHRAPERNQPEPQHQPKIPKRSRCMICGQTFLFFLGIFIITSCESGECRFIHATCLKEKYDYVLDVISQKAVE
jgi:ribosomal protein S27AE